ncbi:retrovirus-related pol polyprotein from transposon TNT 1-94 [Tanacetum coccineum]
MNTSNLFDVLNVEGDDMGDSGKQSKGSEQVNSDFNVNNKKDHEPSSSKSACNDVHKDKNVSSYPELKKWDCINESDTDDDDVIPSYGSFLGGGNQPEDEDFDFYDGYEEQVVDLMFVRVSQEKDTVIRKLKDRIKSLSGKDSVENVKKDIDEIETIYIELEHNKFELIRKTRVQSKEHCDSLIAQINAKSVENSDLNAQLQEKVFAITALKNELRKLKVKNVVDTAVSKPNATIAPGMFKLDIEPISPRLKNNRDAHEVYIEKTIEYTDTLRGFVERARTQNPSEPLLESACMFTKHVQELLVYVSQTCPNSPKPSEKLVVVTPMNKDKRVRFAKPVTSSSNIPKQTDSLKTKDSNKPLLTSTGVKPTTSASGSKPSGNTKNNRITRPPSSNQKNKVEDHSRKVKSSLNKTNSVSEPISNALVKHSVRNAKFESICAICNKCLFDANHDMCLIDFVNDVNWKPTGRFFTIFGNSCPLTRITPKKIVHLKETTSKSVETPKPEIKVYSRRPKQIKSVGSSKKAKIVESKIANNSEPTHLWGSNATDVPSSSFLVNDRLSRLFSGSRDTNLYAISLDNMLKTSTICLLSKASKTKSWLWHRQLSHLNFACALGKSKKSSHQPKSEDTNQEKVYLLHMDLCGPMRVESINGKKYILNGVVKRRNRTLVEAARTMLIFSKAPLFLWAEAINTACYTQNRSLIRLRYNQTTYELMHVKKSDLSFLHVFGSLCYPTNDSEDLGKQNAKADIGIFVGYAPAKKAFRIYNRTTQKIMETIHVTFDELTAMASEQLGLGPGLQSMTPSTSCSGLIPNHIPQQPYFRNDQAVKIMGYGDHQLGNVIISRVYYVEGLGHNLFSVGQFYDADLEVAFRKNTCFIQNLEGVDLISGSKDINLYTISLDDMLKTSPI